MSKIDFNIANFNSNMFLIYIYRLTYLTSLNRFKISFMINEYIGQQLIYIWNIWFGFLIGWFGLIEFDF